MKFLGFAAVSLLMLWGTSVDAGYFKFEDCTKEEFAIANVTKFEISPDPVDLKKNMTWTVHVKILREIPEGAVLKTVYYKIKSVFGIKVELPVPCLLGKFGSCTLYYCKYLALFKQQATPFFPAGKNVCPVQPGDYGGDDLEIEIPHMGRIARFIVGGLYRAELELIMDQKVVGCYKVTTEIR